MSELLETGLAVTVTGMGTVFVLLTLLVGVVHGMSALCAAIAPPPPSGDADTADAEVVGAIAASIDLYRRRHRS
jgi:sodium pump decarboxylase gamma subunit